MDKENTKLEINSLVELKKQHPCGNNTFKIIKNGIDCKLECIKCHHIIMMERIILKKSLKNNM